MTNLTLLVLNVVLMMFVLVIPSLSLMASLVSGFVGILTCTFWIATSANSERIMHERLSTLLEVELRLVEDGPVSFEWRIGSGRPTRLMRLATRGLPIAFIYGYLVLPVVIFSSIQI